MKLPLKNQHRRSFLRLFRASQNSNQTANNYTELQHIACNWYVCRTGAVFSLVQCQALGRSHHNNCNMN